jgi:hypothetical protein
MLIVPPGYWNKPKCTHFLKPSEGKWYYSKLRAILFFDKNKSDFENK